MTPTDQVRALESECQRLRDALTAEQDNNHQGGKPMPIEAEGSQKTVGSIHYKGKKYDIDWWYRAGENGEILECEDAAFIFDGDEQVMDFCQPDWDKHGWESIDDLMADAKRFICGGIMEQSFIDRPKIIEELMQNLRNGKSHD